MRRACLLPAGRLLAAVCCADAADHPVLGPGDYELHPALELSLFAREPDVLDPVSLGFDEFGRAYVAECRDYPYGVGPDGKVGSTIRLLEDTDGDRRTDKATVFARDLSFATGVTPWRGGVLVTAAPDILFLKDTNGDGVADVREVVVTGFARGVSDSLVNGLRFHFDGWIHGANGGSGGTLSSPKMPGVTVKLGDRDFRFRPDTGEIELTAHTGGGFGLVFDDWGNSFTTYNIDHIQQRVADADDFSRFPGMPPVDTTHSISDHGDMARIFPVAPAVTRPNHPEQAGHFSAAGGMGHLGHAGWPGNLPGSLLVCDVVGNLVHRDVLSADGPIFRASRAPEEQTREFFAARDPSFRPVGVELGPDGALYLLDMQRDVIEHPDYIPKKTLAKQDIRAGQDRGRIYRIVPKDAPGTRELPGRVWPGELPTLLGSPNQWTRLTAHRLLLERAEVSVVPVLKEIAAGRARLPDAPPWIHLEKGSRAHLAGVFRLHALALLDGLGALDEPTLLAAMNDSAPGVRGYGIRLAALRAAASRPLADALKAALRDGDAGVRMAASLAVAVLPRDEQLLAALGAQLRSADVPAWNRRAVLAALRTGADAGLALRVLLTGEGLQDAAVPGDAGKVSGPAANRSPGATAAEGQLPSYVTLEREGSASPQAGAEVRDARLEAVSELAQLVGARAGREPGPLTVLLEEVSGDRVPEPLRIAALRGLHEGLARAEGRPATGDAARAALSRLLDTKSKVQLAAAWRLARAFGLPETPAQQAALVQAAADAANTALPLDARTAAIRLLDLGEFSQVATNLFALLNGTQPSAIQQAALAVLREHKEPEVAAGLIAAWPWFAPALRPAVVNLLVYRQGFRGPLLTALEQEKIQVGELNLDLEQRRELLREGPAEARRRAGKFVSDEEYANRSAIVEEWLARLPPSGDATRGRAVFERACAQCHVAAGAGFHVGPELTGMGHRSVEDLLSNILDPNMAMNPAFVAYTAELADGEEETGILAAETPQSVTLLQAAERRVEIPRAKLRQLRSGGRSLMPEGLEAGVTAQEMRDLIALLQAKP